MVCGLTVSKGGDKLGGDSECLATEVCHGLPWSWIHLLTLHQLPWFTRVACPVQCLLLKMWDQRVLESALGNVFLS